MKKLFIPVVVLLVIAFVITGCGGNSPTTSNPAPATSAVVTTTTSAPPITSTTSAPPTSATKPVVTTTTVPVSTTPPITTTGTKVYGGSLRVIETSAPGAPLGAEWEGNTPPVYDTQQWAEERLLKEKSDGTMQPELVQSFEITSTGTTPNVLLHLQKGVKFHDGTDWNAAALAWNLKMFKDGNMFGGTTNYWKSWDIVDDYTLRLNFTVYLNTLTRAWENYFMVSPAAYTKNGIEWVRNHMVGTAAFMQTDYQRDVSTTLIKNPNYWQQGKPYVDKVQLLYVADQLTREALMKSTGAEIMPIQPNQVSHFPAADFKIISKPQGAYTLWPDSKNPDSPWSNPKVRIAADYAIDREGMVAAFGFGYGTPAYQLAEPTSMAFDPALAPQYRKYDIAKAKQLLADAGYPNGFRTTFYVEPLWAAGNGRDIAVALQASWAKAGIIMDLQFPQAAAWQGMSTGMSAPKVSSLLGQQFGEWGNFNTSLNVFFPKSDGGFYYQFTQKPGGNDGWNATKDKSMQTPLPDPVLLKGIGDSFFNECTVFPMWYSVAIYATSPKLNDSGVLGYATVQALDYASAWLSK